MIKRASLFVIGLTVICCMICGCGERAGTVDENVSGPVLKGRRSLKTVEVDESDPLYYLKVVDAEVSSFDQTPDWAPEQDPMAPVDGDMLTRWSSDYEDEVNWIYFDLGKESVISEVIIRWERAYATKFTVEGSNDAENWETLYIVNDNKGGTVKTVFPPVRCRYIRVLGLGKVEEQWGISIWEVEIFGPRSLNPDAVISKKEYLSKADEEKKREEANKLVKQMAAEPVPLSERFFQKGVVYTSWMADELSSAASDFTLIELKKMGFDSVAIMVPAYQEALSSDTIFVNDGPDGDTPSEDSLKHAIRTCHKLGLRVMLKVHVDPRTDEARINIIPSEKWFDSYEKLILRYAHLSARYNVEIFSIGTELEGTTFDAWNHRWYGIIDKIKGIYKGILTYSANWTEYKEVPFWDRLDYVGIDAYFPLTEKNDPTEEELVKAWDEKGEEIEAWLIEKGLQDKGVVLTEIGYTSTDGTNRQPWVAISSTEDQQEQADCLKATFESLGKRKWFKGFYLWQYMPQERWSPLGFTIRNKKAKKVVEDYLSVSDKTVTEGGA